MKVLRRELLATIATMSTSLIYGICLLVNLVADNKDISLYVVELPYALDSIANTVCIVALSGVLNWETEVKILKDRDHRTQAIHHTKTMDLVPEWQEKVHDLASRGFTLEQLLDFFARLGHDLMPHYVPEKHTTNDVVRQAIIPASRCGDGGGVAMATVWNKGKFVPADRLVTHNWDNLFYHLVAAMVADGLDLPLFDHIALDLEE